MMMTGLETRDGTMIKSLFSLALLVCLAATAAAQDGSREMYRWTDENGVVHFSDQRPPGQDVTVIDIPSPAPQTTTEFPQGEGPPTAPQNGAEALSPADQRREEMAKRREEILAAREKNEKICAEKRDEVARLEPNRRVFFANDKGEVERMDDVERTDRVAAAKAYIEAYCQ
jgi:hypothetical protein